MDVEDLRTREPSITKQMTITCLSRGKGRNKHGRDRDRDKDSSAGESPHRTLGRLSGQRGLSNSVPDITRTSTLSGLERSA